MTIFEKKVNALIDFAYADITDDEFISTIKERIFLVIEENDINSFMTLKELILDNKNFINDVIDDFVDGYRIQLHDRFKTMNDTLSSVLCFENK